MTDYGEWIDSRGVSLNALREHGGIWVLDRLPQGDARGLTIWHAMATPKGTLHSLIADWLSESELPRIRLARERYFVNAAANTSDLIFVVEDAHLLSGAVLNQLRHVTELARRPTLVLVGDPSAIRVATASWPSFYQRASYVVKVNRLFE